MEPIDPALFEQLRPALAERDITTLYQALKEAGVSQRQIAGRTGQTQSEVCEILNGRKVIAYDVLDRIAKGLGIPRGYMGLSYATSDTYPEEVMVPTAEEAAAMLRRHLIAYGGIALTGSVVDKLGALLAEMPGPSPVPLPSRLSPEHVAQVQDLTRRLGLGETYCDPETTSAAAWLSTRLLTVSGPEPVKRDLMTAVAELHSVAAWSAHDAGHYERTLYHHARSMELATQAGDTYLQVLALMYAGFAATEHGYPDDGLKMAQFAQVKTWEIRQDDRRAVLVGEHGRAAVEASVLDVCATALGRLGDLNVAVTTLAKGRDLWTPAPSDPFGDMDRPAARLELARGRLDVAEQFATASVRRWTGGRQLSRAQSGAMLATVYVKAGDSRGLPLAHQTLTDLGKLRSVRARQQWLPPLAEVLESRPGSDYADLARTARQVATTRV